MSQRHVRKLHSAVGLIQPQWPPVDQLCSQCQGLFSQTCVIKKGCLLKEYNLPEESALVNLSPSFSQMRAE